MPKEESLPKYSEEELRATRREIISMSLSDNVFFVNVMKEVRLFSHVLSVLLKDKMEVIGEIREVRTEYDIDFRSIRRRSVRLDAIARDSKGNLCHIEMENIPARMTAKRGRFYSAAADIDSLLPGESYDMLKKSFHLFFTDGDAVGNGKTVNIFTRKNQDGEEYGDESYIYVVDINALTDDALGKMLRSLKEPDPNKMEDKVVREVVTYAKGDREMELSIHDTKIKLSKEREEALLEQGRAEGLVEGKTKGESEEKAKTVIECFREGLQIDQIARIARITIEEAEAILKENQIV